MKQTATIVIDRPAGEVFDYVMDIPNDAHWRTSTGVVEAAYTSDPPLGVGTTGFDRISASGRDMIAEWQTVEYEPGRLARWEFVSGPLRGFGSYSCEPVDDSTRFTLEANVKPTGPLRLLGPILGIIVRRQIQADVQKLKSILES
jgi:uncharacterized membrane protein